MFSNNNNFNANQSKTNPFANTQTSSTPSPFNNNTSQNNQAASGSPFTNKATSNTAFGNQTTQGATTPISNQGTNQGQTSFGGTTQNQNQGQGMFGGQGLGSGMFGGGQNNQGQGMLGQNNQQGQGQGMLGQNNQQGQGMFGTNNQQGQGQGMFGATNQQGQGMLGQNNQQGQGMLGGTMFDNQSGSALNNKSMGFSNQYNQNTLQYHHHIESIRHQLEDCVNKIKQRTLEQYRIQPHNIMRNKPLNQLGLNQQIQSIICMFQETKKKIDEIKKQKQTIDKKSGKFKKDMHLKLTLYKKCLLQATTNDKMISEITTEIDMMEREMNEYFKPLFASFQNKKPISLKEPNQFDMKISYSILNKLEYLGNKVDDMITCEEQSTDDQINSAITVFEQLVQYYQNVSCNFKDFKKAYDILKKQAIERERKGTFESVMGRVQKRARENLKNQYKYYDLIKEIDNILSKSEERAQKRQKDYYMDKNSEWNL